MLYDNFDKLSAKDVRKLATKAKNDGWVKLRGSSFVKSLGNGDMVFRSYDTQLITYVNDYEGSGQPMLIVRDGSFHISNTTCRHISNFLRVYFELDYQEVKYVCDLLSPINVTSEFATLDTINVCVVS